MLSLYTSLHLDMFTLFSMVAVKFLLAYLKMCTFQFDLKLVIPSMHNNYLSFAI